MAKFKFTTTDGVIIGAATLLLTFFYYIDKSKPKGGRANPHVGERQVGG